MSLGHSVRIQGLGFRALNFFILNPRQWEAPIMSLGQSTLVALQVAQLEKTELPYSLGAIGVPRRGLS